MELQKLGIAFAAAALILGSGGVAYAEDAPAPIYGQSLMTAEEQAQHRERIRTAGTDEQRNRIRAEHQKQMRVRAAEQGVELPDVAAPAGQVRGRDLMTEEEKARHREEMRGLKTEEERERARKEHHAKMRQRAQERGVTIPEEAPPRGQGRGKGPGPGKGKGGGGGGR